MTKGFMIEMYTTLANRLTDDCYVIGAGTYPHDGKLLPGLLFKEGMDQDGEGPTKITYYNTKRQLTTKQLIKLLTVWEECVIKEKE